LAPSSGCIAKGFGSFGRAALPLIRIMRLGVLASTGWLALAALLWQRHGFLWAFLAVLIWVALLRLFQQAVLALAQSLAEKPS